MDYYTSAWVHAANVAEVKGEQGFVEMLQSVADKLIADGLAQNPQDGGLQLKELEDPKKPPKKPTKTAKLEEELPPTVELDKSLSAGKTDSYTTK